MKPTSNKQQLENKAIAYALDHREFEYLDDLITAYNVQLKDKKVAKEHPNMEFYNLVMDDYNWLKKYGVVTDTSYHALRRVAHYCVNKYYNDRKTK